MPLNVQNFSDSNCRACLKLIKNSKKKFYLFDIFQNEDEQCPRISDLFQKYTLIVMQENDSFPQHICYNCFRKLKSFHEFCNNSIESNEKLLKEKELIEYSSGNQIFVTETEIEDDLLASPDTYSQEEFSDVKLRLSTVGKRAEQARNLVEDADEHDTVEYDLNVDFAENPLESDDKATERIEDGSDSPAGSNKDKFKCEFCSAIFFRKERYDGHMRRHAGLKAFPCSQCDKSFYNQVSRKQHMLIDHSTDHINIPRFECDYCGKIFVRKCNIRAHILKHHANRPKITKKYDNVKIMCEQCGKLLPTRWKLLEHIRLIHANAEPKLQCSICSKSVYENNMHRHLKRHENRKKNICAICGAGFEWNYDLNRHIASHRNEKTFKCEICSHRFVLKNKLTRHINVVHLKQKKHLCTYCNRSFAAQQTLRDHVMTHTGKKRFKCETCGKGFIQQTSFKVHIKTHQPSSDMT